MSTKDSINGSSKNSGLSDEIKELIDAKKKSYLSTISNNISELVSLAAFFAHWGVKGLEMYASYLWMRALADYYDINCIDCDGLKELTKEDVEAMYLQWIILAEKEGSVTEQDVSSAQSKEDIIPVFTPKSLVEELKQYVSGQEEACKALSMVFYNHWMRYCASVYHEEDLSFPRLNALITGPTGTGKTYICEILSNVMDLPIVRIDATNITGTGWAGPDLQEEIGTQLYAWLKSTQDKQKHNKLEHAIIFIDEIDKIGGEANTPKTDKWTSDRQSAYLKIMESSDIAVGYNNARGEFTETARISTDNLTYVFAGSFAALREAKKKLARPIGFGADHFRHKMDSESLLTKEDMIKHGMLRELLGRIHVVTGTHPLTKPEINNIIFNVEDNVFSRFANLFYLGGSDGVELLGDDEVEKLVEDVHKSEFGMRHITTKLFDLLSHKIFELKGFGDPENPREQEGLEA